MTIKQVFAWTMEVARIVVVIKLNTVKTLKA